MRKRTKEKLKGWAALTAIIVVTLHVGFFTHYLLTKPAEEPKPQVIKCDHLRIHGSEEAGSSMSMDEGGWLVIENPIEIQCVPAPKGRPKIKTESLSHGV